MAPNTEAIVPQLRRDFEALVDYVSGPQSRNYDVYTVELHLFRRLLALGAALLKLFFRTRAATRPPTPSTPEGRVMRYHGRRSVRYISIFGHLWLARHYFTAAKQASAAPLDAELSLPDTAFSDLLREWGAYGDTEQAYGGFCITPRKGKINGNGLKQGAFPALFSHGRAILGSPEHLQGRLTNCTL